MKRLIILSMMLLYSCQYLEEDHQIEKKEVVQAIYSHIGWAIPDKKKDLVINSVLQDSSFFIFHPDSSGTIAGFESFENLVDNFFMNPKFKSNDFTIKNLRVNISESGTVAWFSCLLDDYGEWNGKPANWLNARWTGVLEKRKDKWLIAQMHFSFSK
jgi:ketosteroid isomerase-like protein